MKVLAHRGNDGIHKENTLESIMNIINKPFVDGVEFDIRFTKDKKFILSHNIIICGKIIKNNSSKYFQKLGINTLEEILNNIKNNKIILIEVKEESLQYKALAPKLYKIINKYPLNIKICSFNYSFLEYFHKKYPNISVGLIISKNININKIENKFNFNVLHYKHINKKIKKETYIWNVNSIDIYQQIKHKDCNIITDKASLIAKYLGRQF